MIKKAHKIEGYLKTAASYGHTGIIKSLCSMPETKLIINKSLKVDGEDVKFVS